MCNASPLAAHPAVRVIIVNYNGGAYLAHCLRALAAQTHHDFEAVVVDNGSTDGSMEAVPTDDARFTSMPLAENTGFAAANNRGAAGAQTPWLALLNPDAFPEPDWLENLLAESRRLPGVAMIGSTQLLAECDETILDGAGDNMPAFGYPWRGGFLKPHSPPWPAGETFAPCAAAALYDRALFEAVGGFDERFFCYCEDVDLAFRMRLMGGRAYQSGKAVVHHVSSGIAGRGSDFGLYHGYRNGLWMTFKCMPMPLMPFTIAGQVMTLAGVWLRNRLRGRNIPVWRALTDAFRGMVLMRADRSRLQAQRKVGVWAIARILVWSPQAYMKRRIVLRQW